MNLKQQEEHFEELSKLLKTILFKKGNDYANEDRLSNFKDSAKIIGISPSKLALSMIAIKTSRLANLIDSLDIQNESINDSILDLTNYSILLHMIQNE